MHKLRDSHGDPEEDLRAKLEAVAGRRKVYVLGLGNTDEVVSTQEESDIEVTGESAQLRYLEESDFAPVRESALATGLVDGVAPSVSETVGVQDLSTRRNEPRVYLAAMDPAYMDGFGQIRNVSGGILSLLESGKHRKRPAAELLGVMEAQERPGRRRRRFGGPFRRSLAWRGRGVPQQGSRAGTRSEPG